MCRSAAGVTEADDDAVDEDDDELAVVVVVVVVVVIVTVVSTGASSPDPHAVTKRTDAATVATCLNLIA